LYDKSVVKSPQFKEKGDFKITVNDSIKKFDIISIKYISETLRVNPKRKTTNAEQPKALEQLYILFHQLVITINDVRAGCLGIERVVGLQHKHDFTKFVNFLEVLDVYGTGYSDDIHHRLYR
jgi:hypothetical protein